MRLARLLVVVVATALAVGCGKEIGDDCSLNIDCDPEGQRTCDLASPDGYCTIPGCTFDSCPEESICVSFFIASFENRACDFGGADVCGRDEVCTLSGQCVSSGSEVRYCMRKCSEGDDCRDGYECRNEQLMVDNGGQPVSPPGEALVGELQAFCAAAPG